MRAIDTSVFEFLTAQRTYIIPVYQRNYDWGVDNCKKLLDDIIKVGNSNDPEYFLGSFVIVQQNDNPFNFFIIDGQQRLTTLTLLLLAIYHNDSEIAKGTAPQIERLIFSNIASSDKRLILKQIQKDDDNLYKIIQNQTFNEEESNILNNYTYFSKYIDNNTENILTIIRSITQKLRVVQITLGKDDQPQLVFETLNATGKELSEADKIRNFILMYEEQEHLYENYWVKIEKDCLQHINQNSISNFMKAFLTIVHRSEVIKPIKDNNVYEVFKDYYNKSNKNNKDILSLMKEYSSCYHKILSPNSYKGNYINSLRNIQELELNVLNPLILCVLKLEQDRIISLEITTSIIQTLENYLVRRRLSDTQSNALNKVAFALIHKLLSLSDEQTIKQTFEETLLGYKGNARFPKDDEIFSNLMYKAIYTARSLGRFILKQLEFNHSKEKNDFEDITIEHIMPQKLNAEWIKELGENANAIHEIYLHTLGNLTFTGYNPELGNKPFSEKYPILNNSKFRFLNEEFKENFDLSLSIWNQEHIKNRTHRLTKAILDIYPYPNIDSLYSSLDITDEEDFTSKEIVSFEYNSTRYEVQDNTWASFMVELCELLYNEDPVKFQHTIIDNPEFANRFSLEFKNGSSLIDIKDKKFYIHTSTDTNTKIRTLNRILETLDLVDIPITLYIKSN